MLGIGDVVSVTIFEAAAGGLFIPIEAGVRPGNFVTFPNQNVDTLGNIMVPYSGGPIRAAGRTVQQVQEEIVNSLKNRAIEPQAVIATIENRSSLISVLGDVNNPSRFPANAAGEHILDAITRAGGPKSQGYDSWVSWSARAAAKSCHSEHWSTNLGSTISGHIRRIQFTYIRSRKPS